MSQKDERTAQLEAQLTKLTSSCTVLLVLCCAVRARRDEDYRPPIAKMVRLLSIMLRNRKKNRGIRRVGNESLSRVALMGKELGSHAHIQQLLSFHLFCARCIACTLHCRGAKACSQHARAGPELRMDLGEAGPIACGAASRWIT